MNESKYEEQNQRWGGETNIMTIPKTMNVLEALLWNHKSAEGTKEVADALTSALVFLKQIEEYKVIFKCHTVAKLQANLTKAKKAIEILQRDCSDNYNKLQEYFMENIRLKKGLEASVLVPKERLEVGEIDKAMLHFVIGHPSPINGICIEVHDMRRLVATAVKEFMEKEDA